jgi:SAM-dependent methyltransferase
MGGVMPEQPDPARFRRVLDVGCGPGGWLIETAQTYPAITSLVGIDVNSKMVEYARTQADPLGLENRVQFTTMDALRPLKFPSESFDLLNQRLGWSFLRTWDWLKLLVEYQRVTCAGGVIRITESEAIGQSTSPTLARLFAIRQEAFYRAGHLFSPERTGVTSQLTGLLQHVGLRDVHTRTCALEYRMDTASGRQWSENIRIGLQTMLPFLHKWSRVPNDYEQLCQQALTEMRHSDFVATWSITTAWGINPEGRLAKDDR